RHPANPQLPSLSSTAHSCRSRRPPELCLAAQGPHQAVTVAASMRHLRSHPTIPSLTRKGGNNVITIPRCLARQFRALLRRCAGPADRRRDPFILIRSSLRGLSLESVLNAVAVRVELLGQQTDNTVLAFTGSVLAQLEGRGED